MQVTSNNDQTNSKHIDRHFIRWTFDNFGYPVDKCSRWYVFIRTCIGDNVDYHYCISLFNLYRYFKIHIQDSIIFDNFISHNNNWLYIFSLQTLLTDLDNYNSDQLFGRSGFGFGKCIRQHIDTGYKRNWLY